jgi:hypothetical protein
LGCQPSVSSVATAQFRLSDDGERGYNWEAGTTRPRAVHLSAIAALRLLGKKDADARLASMRAAR